MIQFLRELWQSLSHGGLFFGGPLDLLIMVLDFITTFLVIYFILRIVRDSRAWQLLKGLLIIFGFALLSSLIGLNTIGFMLNNTITLFAFAFVVLFQPELRRALETVGRSRIKVLSNGRTGEQSLLETGSMHQMIESIVNACEWMANSMTGALIIIERQTRLGDLLEQENALLMDATVSSTLLKQIFYAGSPLHDGAVLIRDGRVAAARIHVPLSDLYHLRRDYGTRHRAAIGASEMGDAISIVVSEERGAISLAVDGRLYTLDNADALRTQLHQLMSPRRSVGIKLPRILRLRRKSDFADEDPATVGPTVKPSWRQRHPASVILISLVLSIIVWLFVQITVNPIVARNYTVSLSFHNETVARDRGYQVLYPVETIQLTLKGRKKLLDSINTRDIDAYIDLAKIERTGIQNLPIQTDIDTALYTVVDALSPAQITVNVRAAGTP